MNVGGWGIIRLLYSYYHISHKTPWSVSILLVCDTFVLSAKARRLHFFFLTIGLVSVFLQITANRNKLFLTTIYCSILPNKAGHELLSRRGGLLPLPLSSPRLLRAQFRDRHLGEDARGRGLVGTLLRVPEASVTSWLGPHPMRGPRGAGAWEQGGGPPFSTPPGPDRKWRPAGRSGQAPSP